MVKEGGEELELHGCDLDWFAATAQLAAPEVHFHFSESVNLGQFPAGAPQQGLAPGPELPRTERLGDVIIGASGVVGNNISISDCLGLS